MLAANNRDTAERALVSDSQPGLEAMPVVKMGTVKFCKLVVGQEWLQTDRTRIIFRGLNVFELLRLDQGLLGFTSCSTAETSHY